jgi:deoxycytidylate deaminase
MPANPHVIGLTGSFGSGCTTIAEQILAKRGYTLLSLSDSLRSAYEAGGASYAQANRSDKQDFGDKMRKEQGADVFARQVAVEIEKNAATGKWVVDSIRNPAEVKYFRDKFQNFFLVGVYADKEERWRRVTVPYAGSRDHFNADDGRDSGLDTPDHGQKVQDCFSEADVVISNEKHHEVPGAAVTELASIVEKYANLVATPLTRNQPSSDESRMAMAYATAQLSSCLKRKVGAVITDAAGAVIGSGFNEVPPEERPCSKVYEKCYRDHSRAQFIDEMAEKFQSLAGHRADLEKVFRKHFRILDICRALHAEENALMSLVRNGRATSLRECTLYTTTYPCRLCANKIVTAGIGTIVYVEPYPDDEAKAILARVTRRFFNGVTHRAFFRVYGDQK